MKVVLKLAWVAETDAKRMEQLEVAFMFLSDFRKTSGQFQSSASLAPTWHFSWVIRASFGERTTYLSDDAGIAMFRCVDAALKFVQATRPDLAQRVEVGELVNVTEASRAGDAMGGLADPEYQP